MKIFLSYASEDREVAEQVRLGLAHEGHDVFFDREDLPPGSDFHSRIRKGIEQSDLFLFLVSGKAFDAGSYTINELAIAQKKWPHPAGHVLPVLLHATDLTQVPGYLKSITLLQPEGDMPAAVVDAVHRIAVARRRALMTKLAVGAAGIATLAIIAGYVVTGRSPADEMTGKDGAVAVRIPAGVFIMGDDENSPRREIYTDAYYIDRFEVTTARYARFMAANPSLRAPDGWDEIKLDRAAELPVAGVDWKEAQAYCRWADKRLPTEAEWEKAARGTDGRLYPWGNETPNPERANFENTSPKAYEGGLTPVGSHPAGKSPFGVHDMAGNVSEWVADWHSEHFASGDTRNPQGPERGDRKVIRGGGRFDQGHRIAATKRYFASPEQRSEEIGFRCAR